MSDELKGDLAKKATKFNKIVDLSSEFLKTMFPYAYQLIEEIKKRNSEKNTKETMKNKKKHVKKAPVSPVS